MSFLSKIEDLLMQVIKLVLLAFALWLLFAWGSHLYEKSDFKKTDTTTEASVDWKQVKPDMQFVVEETSRDLDLYVPNKLLQERLTDAQLRPAFQKADQLLRDFVAQKAEQHARIEKENQSRGLAPLNPLLVGEALPTAKDIAAYNLAQQAVLDAEQAQEKAREERMARLWEEAASDAAAAAEAPAAEAMAAEAMAVEASDGEEECCWTDAVDVAQVLDNNAVSHGEQGYAAFVQGAPAAIELVLQNATLAPKLHEMTVSRLLDMVMMNYSISFSRAVSDQDSDSESLWESLFSSIDLAVWSLILSFLALVVFVATGIRMEKHLRRMSQNSATRD